MRCKLVNSVDAWYIGYRALKERLPGKMSFSLFKRAMQDAGYKAQSIHCDGEPAGAFFTERNEVHVAILPEFRRLWLNRMLFLEGMRPIMNSYGMIVTSVMADNATGHDFVTRLGFEKTGESNGMVNYALHALPF